MSLGNVITNPAPKPQRILIYGTDGIGKTTFAAGADAPIFLAAEDGLVRYPELPRFPEPHTWLDAMAAIDNLAAPGHAYRTVVIDTLDWLEPLCWVHVLAGVRRKDGRPYASIGDMPFGDGYTAARDHWRVLLSKLDHLRTTRGVAPILIAHSWIRPFHNPEGDDYDRHEIKLNKHLAPLIREWVDVVLFAAHEQYTHEQNGRAKGISTGARIIHTERTAAFDAKNRHNLPAQIPLDWPAFAEALVAGQRAEPLRARIDALLDGAPAELQERVRAAVQHAANNTAELARISNKLQATLSIEQQQQPQPQQESTHERVD